MSSRLNLVRAFLSQSGSSGDAAERTKAPSSGEAPSEGVDSGFQTRTPESTPTTQRKGIGRGQLTSDAGRATGTSGADSSESDDKQSSIGSAMPSLSGRGRAQFIQALIRQPFEPAPSVVSDDSSSMVSARVSQIACGRGRFIQQLLNTAADAESIETQSNGKHDELSEAVSQVTIAETVETVEKAPVIKTGSSGN